MISMKKSGLLATALLGSVLCGQDNSIAVVPGPVAEGVMRPHLRISAIADPGAVLHGPGATNCDGVTNACYYLGPDLIKAYGVNLITNGNGGAGMTIAIVDAFYNSQTEADLGTFISAMHSVFGITLPACTIANGCLTIVNQTGGTNMSGVGFNQGWAQETDLDIQTVHAIAPNAKILLVACNSASASDLFAGVVYARAHANVVSNSYGGNEFAGQASLDAIYFAGSPVPLLFSSGDFGATVEYPCSSPYATCVGGTHLLTTAASLRSAESAWGDGTAGDGGAGGGCSTQESAPGYQTGFNTCGGFRGVPDIGGLADPNTGFVVFLGTNAGGSGSNLYLFGGTSLASPIEASIIAIIDAARVAIGKSPLGGNLNTLLYQAAAGSLIRLRYFDVATGSTGFTATAGWDKTVGLGVPASSLASYLVNSVP